MATILNDAPYMGFPLSIKRGNPAPVDTTAVWYNKAELEAYAKSGATAYVGQVLTLVADSKCEAYMISNEAGTLIKLASTTASGDLASDVATLQGQVADLVSKVGSAKAGDTAASGLYALIETAQAQANKGVTDAASAKSAADAAQSDVDALEEVVGANDTAGLRKRIKANETAISTLQGEDTSKSARTIAQEEVAKIVDGAPGSFDTLKEIAEWIATHGTEAADLATAVTKLQGVLAGFGGEGEPAVVKSYIDGAISALKIGDYAKAADLTALAARVTTLEGKPAIAITADDIAAWNAKQDAGDYVEQSTYDTKVKALEDADSANATAIAGVKATADAAVPKNAATKAQTGIKVTTDANGLVTAVAGLSKDDIPAIDQSQVTGLASALAGKQDSLVFNTAYDASTNKVATMGDIGDAKNALVGSSEDKSSVDTIKGAKKLAEEKSASALADAKAYADGLVTGDSGITKRVETLEGKVDVAKVSTAIATAKSEAISDAESKIALTKTTILGQTDEGIDFNKTVKDAYELANIAKTETDDINFFVNGAVQEVNKKFTEIDNKIGEVPAEKTLVQMIADAQAAATYDDTALSARVTANKNAIDVLVGSVAGDGAKSAREMAQEEVAKIVADAPESFDTLKEIATWISEHSEDATAMDNQIQANKNAIATLNGTGAGSVSKAVSDAVTPVANRVTTLEGKVTDEKIAKWDAGQANVIESVKVGGTALAIREKTVNIPAASATAFGAVKVDNTSIESNAGVIGVKAVGVSKLFVEEGTEFVLFGGNA